MARLPPVVPRRFRKLTLQQEFINALRETLGLGPLYPVASIGSGLQSHPDIRPRNQRVRSRRFFWS
jgi:hypothetical protein